MDAMIIVHMQTLLHDGLPKLDLTGVIDRINQLAALIRRQSGAIIWIQHCGKDGGKSDASQMKWPLLPELDQQASDILVETTLNDAFAGTELQSTLEALAPDRVLIAGWATDFCVDATVRSAVSKDYNVVAVSDGHTLNDRPHLPAPDVIRHHNWVWSNLITNASIRVVSAAELLGEYAQPIETIPRA